METKKDFLFIIVGLGSIGKYHAKSYLKHYQDLVIIDPDKNILPWAKKNINKTFVHFEKIKDSIPYLNSSPLHKIAIISNWGHLHYSSFEKIKALGVDKFLIEKPVSNSLKQLDDILLAIKKEKIQVVSGFGWRHSGMPEKIKSISTEDLGGNPQSISMNGGAFGIVTNGIHFLDLAISIFETSPLSVFSNLKSDKINPRSKKLDFWSGVSSWAFPDNRNLVIQASNMSSVSPYVEVICPTGKIVINSDMSLNVFKRDEIEIKNDPRIIRLGVPRHDKELDYLPNYSAATRNLIDPLIKNTNNFQIDSEREIIATKCMIYALISSIKEKKIFIKRNIEKKYYDERWMIS